MTMLKLQLVDVTDWKIKGPQDSAYKGVLPTRMKYIHPSALAGLRAITLDNQFKVAISDMFRSPMASLEARQRKTGVQRPGYSAHNYGIAIDVDVDQTLTLMSMTYSDFLAWMSQSGWTCHRSDQKRGSEDWHFNLLGMGATPPTGAAGPQRWIVNTYGKELTGDERWAQQCLHSLKLYEGEIDGDFGNLSRAALLAFQRMYKIPEDCVLDELTCRSLAIATAEMEIVKKV
jgi:peptidoglycan hydrolase-like protein with peptidoglycan-binding domain